MARIAVIGLGEMGSRIAVRLRDAGHDVAGWSRSRSEGGSPADAARDAELVITMVSDERALEDVTTFESGSSFVLVQMSTVGPRAINDLAARLPSTIELLDAPVLGSIGEVEAGTLHIFAGGEPELVERVSPVLSLLGQVHHVGGVGAGSAVKLVANFALLSTIAALGEALGLADELGVPRDTAFDVLTLTPLAAQAERRRPAVERNEYPARFGLGLAAKDARLIVEAARDLPLATAVQSWFQRALESGLSDEDYTAVLAEILER